VSSGPALLDRTTVCRPCTGSRLFSVSNSRNKKKKEKKKDGKGGGGKGGKRKRGRKGIGGTIDPPHCRKPLVNHIGREEGRGKRGKHQRKEKKREEEERREDGLLAAAC